MALKFIGYCLVSLSSPMALSRITALSNYDIHLPTKLTINLHATDEALKPANVFSTLAAMSLCRTLDKPKFFCFISSTSVLDTDHYIQLSSSGTPVRESDDLEGSRLRLGTGYGQSKWVSEYLVREAGKRGLRGCIVRPGYVTGDSSSGGKDSPFFKTPTTIGETVAGNMT